MELLNTIGLEKADERSMLQVKMLICLFSVLNQTRPNIVANLMQIMILCTRLNIDNFQNIKVYKKNKKKNSWIKIDG